ncbi:hypothetical protein IV53_GL000370 [Ligilactobacillus ceti DSM 22408]|uniref:Biotin transporter n=2 Tax=Ligilactobacillus TaxID=2767887 RepID=A0A0R2KKW2_9LACO|nr:hypothetical protein IV53_GL000370 [Ligilactobacillus ceti DSM 22408]
MKMKTKDLTQIAFMIAIIVILGFIPPLPLGFIPVPIIFQNMGVMLAGLLLGKKKGTWAVVGFVLLGIVGVPVFTGGRSIIPVITGPTAGYVLAWLVTPYLIGRGVELMQAKDKMVLQWISVVVAGVLFVDLCGSIWLSVYTKMPLMQAILGNTVFIPGDLIKATLAVVVVKALVHNQRMRMLLNY